jgi:hypothetical protein
MYKQGLSIDEALAQSQQRLSEYSKNIADEAYPTLIAEIDRLKEENARYREALEDIVHCIYGNEATFQWVEKKAREALKGEK